MHLKAVLKIDYLSYCGPHRDINGEKDTKINTVFKQRSEC
jgi:hypothetical protein